MKHNMTTTAFTLDGYRIVETKGLVRGVIVRSRSIVGTIGASLQTILRGNISLFTEPVRTHAGRRVSAHARPCATAWSQRRHRHSL